MKNVKRIIAIVGVLLLVAMYVTTLFLAIFSPDNAMGMFHASIYGSIVIPVLIWALIFIYSSGKKRRENTEDAMKVNNELSRRANMKASASKEETKVKTTEQ